MNLLWHRTSRWLSLSFLCGFLCSQALLAAEPAEFLLTGGRIHTLDPDNPTAEAIAVGNGRVVYVGSNEGGLEFVGPDTVVDDVTGHTVLPGLIDAHVHPSWGEFLLRRLCDVQSYTLEDGYDKLAKCAANAPAGDWVVAYGWYMTDNSRLGEVTLEKLDAIVPDRNLVIIARDHHTFWVNSRTLQILGVDRDTPDPAGGSYGRDPVTGELTGVLHDAANRPLQAMIETRSSYAANAKELYGTAITYLNSLGVTSLLDALVNDEAEAAYHALDARGDLTMNVSLAFAVTAANFRTEIPRIAAKRSRQTAHTRIDYVKVFADGNLEDGLANMLEADGTQGEASHGYFTQAEMDELVALAEQHRLSVFVHVIGDGAARQALDSIAKARRTAPCDWCRHTLTHLQWVHPADKKRFKQLNVIANLQENWLAPRSFGGPPGYDYARETGAGPIGQRLADSMFPYRDLHVAGAALAAGSDWFFTDENPWHAIAIGATSKDLDLPDGDAMLPMQTLDIETLLGMHTTGAAFQLQDPQRGRLAVGAPADIIVVDRDVLAVSPAEIAGTRVVATYVEGRQVWSQQRLD